MTDTYSYPATSNRLSTVALGAGGSRAFTYDGAGNVTLDNRTGGGYSYTYDAAGRMATFSINGVLQASYRYDYLGRLVSRALTGGLTIHSVFDSAGNRIAEYNQATGALIREYIWLNGAPIAVVEGGVIYYVRTDHIGRPVFATNAAGVKVWTASYLPFGGLRVSTGVPLALRFPGQWFQSDSGLHQNWMRDYDPTTGRYIQADPLGLVDGASVYGYARQSPGRHTDPTGEFVPVIAGILLGLVIDVVIDKLESDCGCYETGAFVPEIPGMWEVYGGYTGGFGAFERKTRTGIAGGGKSAGWTSTWSYYFGSDKSNPAGAARRAAGRKAAKLIPYVGGALALYDVSRFGSCLYDKWSRP